MSINGNQESEDKENFKETKNKNDMEKVNIKRSFILVKGQEKITLPDPNPQMTPEQVMTFHSASHPELTTCTVDGPKYRKDAIVYEFRSTMGTKG